MPSDPQDAPQAPPWLDKDVWQEELDGRDPAQPTAGYAAAECAPHKHVGHCGVCLKLMVDKDAPDAEFKRDILDFLSIPNVSGLPGEHIPYHQLVEHLDRLRRKHLP